MAVATTSSFVIMTGIDQTEHSMSSNLNANAEDFIPSMIEFVHEQNDQNAVDEPKSTQSWNVSADEFVPLVTNTCAVDSMVKAWSPAPMNVNAEEFAPGLGLSEFGQTVEGWQGLGQRLETTFNTEATLLNVFAINPAFFCDDDESEDESDDVLENHSKNANGNEDEQSNGGNQESNVSTVDSSEDFATKDTSNYGDTESSDENRDCNEILFDSDKDSNDGRPEAPELAKCANSIADDSDKETSYNDGSDDLHTSSADESISLGTVSDAEMTPMSLRPPPGLSVPWKVKPRVADLHDSSEDDSVSIPEVRTTSPYRSRPWKLPPWKNTNNLEVAGEGQTTTPVSSTPPWRKAEPEPSIVSSEGAHSPPGLSLPPWKLPGWKQASKGEAAADLIAEDEDFLQRPAARLPAWRR